MDSLIAVQRRFVLYLLSEECFKHALLSLHYSCSPTCREADETQCAPLAFGGSLAYPTCAVSLARPKEGKRSEYGAAEIRDAPKSRYACSSLARSYP